MSRQRESSARHSPAELLGRYARGDTSMPADVLWSLEVHLEACTTCRVSLARHAPQLLDLVARCWREIEPRATEVVPARRRRGWPFPWLSPAMVPWLVTTVLVSLLALVADQVTAAMTDERYPSLTLLLAPVLPLAAVAVSWSRRLDPAHELLITSPRAGLHLLLVRTVAVLITVVPPLTVSGWIAGTSPARSLLPCLAYTVLTLALGGFVGVRAAATGLAMLWAAGVLGPSLLTATSPAMLDGAAMSGWVALACGGLVVVCMRGSVLARLGFDDE